MANGTETNIASELADSPELPPVDLDPTAPSPTSGEEVAKAQLVARGVPEEQITPKALEIGRGIAGIQGALEGSKDPQTGSVDRGTLIQALGSLSRTQRELGGTTILKQRQGSGLSSEEQIGLAFASLLPVVAGAILGEVAGVGATTGVLGGLSGAGKAGETFFDARKTQIAQEQALAKEQREFETEERRREEDQIFDLLEGEIEFGDRKRLLELKTTAAIKKEQLLFPIKLKLAQANATTINLKLPSKLEDELVQADSTIAVGNQVVQALRSLPPPEKDPLKLSAQILAFQGNARLFPTSPEGQIFTQAKEFATDHLKAKQGSRPSDTDLKFFLQLSLGNLTSHPHGIADLIQQKITNIELSQIAKKEGFLLLRSQQGDIMAKGVDESDLRTADRVLDVRRLGAEEAIRQAMEWRPGRKLIFINQEGQLKKFLRDDKVKGGLREIE